MGKYPFLLSLVLLISVAVYAQDSTRVGTKIGFLPALSFNSDNGIYIGLQSQIYNYGDYQPFESYSRINVSYQSIGAFGISLFHDKVKTLGTDIRSSYDFLMSQNLGNYYFGDTEEIPFEKARFDTTSYYAFKSFRTSTGVSTRFPIYFGEGNSRFDLKTGLRIVYEKPWDINPNSFISNQKYAGYDGSFVTFLEFGLLYEARDNEFVSQRGIRIDVGTKIAPPLLSTHVTAENYLSLKAFYPLLTSRKRSLTLASRFFLQNTVGDTPYWFVPKIGSGGTIRGVFYSRFSSDNAISYSIEARTWLIPINYKNINLGLNFFVDGGRVFKNDNWGGFLADHIHSLGFGGVMSIFTPDFILKYDLGFSEIGTGIYLGTGYSF